MFRNPADGLRADRAPGTVGAARRRRDRRLRAFLKHERLSVAMNMATVQHHSYMKSAVVDFCVQVGSPLAPVTEYVAPAPAVALSVPCQQLRPATVATGVNLDVTGMVHPQFSSTAVEGSASQVVGSLPLGEVSVATGVNLDVTGMVYPQFSSTAVDGSASQVVGSLSLGQVFAAPVFNQVHQEQLAGGVSRVSRVAHTLPPAEEFTDPVCNPVHREQFSAGETTENIVNFPVVQEQVLVQAIPRLVGSSPPVDEFTAYVVMRPLPLVEVQPSVRAQRHIVEDLAPLVQILDLLVPRTVDSVTDVLRLLDRPLVEQAISMPKISCSPCPSRSRVSEPQSAEQLVEVPTVLTPTRIAVQIAEQIVDTSVPRGRARGSLPVQSSAAQTTSARRRFTGRIWHMPVAELYGFIESDSVEGDVPFFLAGSCRLGDLVTFAVGRGADGLEAYDLKVVGRGEGVGIPSPPSWVPRAVFPCLSASLSTTVAVHGLFYW